MKFKRALFLDRDGVINKEINYAFRIDQIKFVPGIFDLVREAKKLDYHVIVITNQAGIAKGYYTVRDYLDLMKWMKSEFLKNNARLDHIYFCPFHPDAMIERYRKESELRKPASGMILKAQKRFNLDLANSILVGDRMTDMLAGNRAAIGKLFLFGEKDSQESNDVHLIPIQELTSVIPYL